MLHNATTSSSLVKSPLRSGSVTAHAGFTLAPMLLNMLRNMSSEAATRMSAATTATTTARTTGFGVHLTKDDVRDMNILANVVNPCVAIFGVIQSIICIYVFQQKSLRSSSTVYLSALAFCDILSVTCKVLLTSVEWWVSKGNFEAFGNKYAHMYVKFGPLIELLTDCIVCFSAAAIMDHFAFVKYPIKSAKYTVQEKATTYVTLVFCLIFLCSFLNFFKYYIQEYKVGDEYVSEICAGEIYLNNSFQYYTNYVHLAVFRIMPLVAVCFAFLILLVHHCTQDVTEGYQRIFKTGRSFKMLGAMTLFLLSTMTPVVSFKIMYLSEVNVFVDGPTCYNSIREPQLVGHLPRHQMAIFVCTSINSCCKIFLYVFFGRTFRKGLVNAFTCPPCRQAEDEVPRTKEDKKTGPVIKIIKEEDKSVVPTIQIDKPEDRYKVVFRNNKYWKIPINPVNVDKDPLLPTVPEETDAISLSSTNSEIIRRYGSDSSMMPPLGLYHHRHKKRRGSKLLDNPIAALFVKGVQQQHNDTGVDNRSYSNDLGKKISNFNKANLNSTTNIPMAEYYSSQDRPTSYPTTPRDRDNRRIAASHDMASPRGSYHERLDRLTALGNSERDQERSDPDLGRISPPDSVQLGRRGRTDWQLDRTHDRDRMVGDRRDRGGARTPPLRTDERRYDRYPERSNDRRPLPPRPNKRGDNGRTRSQRQSSMEISDSSYDSGFDRDHTFSNDTSTDTLRVVDTLPRKYELPSRPRILPRQETSFSDEQSPTTHVHRNPKTRLNNSPTPHRRSRLGGGYNDTDNMHHRTLPQTNANRQYCNIDRVGGFHRNVDRRRPAILPRSASITNSSIESDVEDKYHEYVSTSSSGSDDDRSLRISDDESSQPSFTAYSDQDKPGLNRSSSGFYANNNIGSQSTDLVSPSGSYNNFAFEGDSADEEEDDFEDEDDDGLWT